MSDQQANCDAFLALLRPAFPDSFIHARPWGFMGTKNISITFAIDPKEKWNNGIRENDPANCGFLVSKHSLIDGFYIGQPTLHFTNRFQTVGIKFRKIKATTEMEALTKLAQWFLKNQAALHSLKKGD
jgi:hypothetical protein